MKKSTHSIAISVLSVQSFSSSQTKNIAQTLAKTLLESQPAKVARVCALTGELGSGKTTFAQGFAKGLGITEKILSPTFILMRSYKLQATNYKLFYHIDCYRLDNPMKELVHLGFTGIIKNPRNIVVIEWADRIKRILPSNTIWVYFKTTDKARRELWIK